MHNLPSMSGKPLYWKVYSVAVLWCLGFLLGFCLCAKSNPIIFSLMRQAAARPMSIVGLLSIICIPYLLTALAVQYNKILTVVLLAFLKAFLFGFSFCCIRFSFEYLHWIIQPMLMFTDIVSTFFLLSIWVNTILGRANLRSVFSGAVVSFFFGILDILLVSPFLGSLINDW